MVSRRSSPIYTLISPGPRPSPHVSLNTIRSLLYTVITSSRISYCLASPHARKLAHSIAPPMSNHFVGFAMGSRYH